MPGAVSTLVKVVRPPKTFERQGLMIYHNDISERPLVEQGISFKIHEIEI